jgi:hypothetical protein
VISPNNPDNWTPIVDPECPAVMAQQGQQATDPLDLLDGLSYEDKSDWEVQHRRTCNRCQTYGQQEKSTDDGQEAEEDGQRGDHGEPDSF